MNVMLLDNNFDEELADLNFEKVFMRAKEVHGYKTIVQWTEDKFFFHSQPSCIPRDEPIIRWIF